MRKFVLLSVYIVAALFGFMAEQLHAASSNTNAMTVRFNFTAYLQAPQQGVTNSTTTNTIYKVTRARFSNKDLLKLIASEFSTSFPDGAQLGLTVGFDFVVLDKLGNVLLNVSTNADTNYVFNITNVTITAITARIEGTSTKTTEVASEIGPDFSFAYADGKGNNFHFGGLVTIRVSATQVGSTASYKNVFVGVSNGAGGGKFFNSNDFKYDPVVFTGTWAASGSNLGTP